jgi:hypothetical protein
MKKLALIAGAGLLALGSVGPAQAQRFYDDDDDWSPSTRVVRERVVVRQAPAIREEVIVRRAPVIRERIVYRSAPVIRQRVVYRQAPVVRQRVVYRQAPIVRRTRVVYRQAPVVRQRVVVRQAPVYQTQRVVYRSAPVVWQRVVYEQPRSRMVYSQPEYSTRVTFREPRRERVLVRSTVRDDIETTGTLGNRWEGRMQRRMMRDW